LCGQLLPLFVITQIEPASSSEMSPPELSGLGCHHRNWTHLIMS
jgi:hypothetical protein